MNDKVKFSEKKYSTFLLPFVRSREKMDFLVSLWQSCKCRSRQNQLCYQRSRLTVANSKFATGKSHSLPAKNVGSKRLLPGNSVMNMISWKNKPVLTEITLPFIRQNTVPYGQRHYQCL